MNHTEYASPGPYDIAGRQPPRCPSSGYEQPCCRAAGGGGSARAALQHRWPVVVVGLGCGYSIDVPWMLCLQQRGAIVVVTGLRRTATVGPSLLPRRTVAVNARNAGIVEGRDRVECLVRGPVPCHVRGLDQNSLQKKGHPTTGHRCGSHLARVGCRAAAKGT